MGKHGFVLAVACMALQADYASPVSRVDCFSEVRESRPGDTSCRALGVGLLSLVCFILRAPSCIGVLQRERASLEDLVVVSNVGVPVVASGSKGPRRPQVIWRVSAQAVEGS